MNHLRYENNKNEHTQMKYLNSIQKKQNFKG